MEIVYKEIVGYQGRYKVSNTGIVINCETGHILKPDVSDGYFQVTLSMNGKKNRFKVHRLVANAFIKNPECKPCIDHIDTDRKNNDVSNLRWCNNKENSNNNRTRFHISQSQIGKVLSLETKSKISNSRKGKYCGEDNHMYGTHFTEEQKKNLQKQVSQFTKDGKLVKTWKGITEASESLGIDKSHIVKVCKGKRNHAGGFIWTYA